MISPKVMIQVQPLLPNLVLPVSGSFASEKHLFVSLNLGNRAFYYDSLMEFRALKGVDGLGFFEVQKKSMAQNTTVL